MFSRNTTNSLSIYKTGNMFGTSSHHQPNLQTMLKLHSVDVHIVGSQLFTNQMAVMTVICTFYCRTICKQLGSHNVHIY